MSLEVGAIYESGILKLDHPLPLHEHERVTVSIKPRTNHVDETFGCVPTPDDIEALDYLAHSPANGLWERE